MVASDWPAQQQQFAALTLRLLVFKLWLLSLGLLWQFCTVKGSLILNLMCLRHMTVESWLRDSSSSFSDSVRAQACRPRQAMVTTGLDAPWLAEHCGRRPAGRSSGSAQLRAQACGPRTGPLAQACGPRTWHQVQRLTFGSSCMSAGRVNLRVQRLRAQAGGPRTFGFSTFGRKPAGREPSGSAPSGASRRAENLRVQHLRAQAGGPRTFKRLRAQACGPRTFGLRVLSTSGRRPAGREPGAAPAGREPSG